MTNEREDELKRAHATAERCRQVGAEIPPAVQDLEREYYAMVKRWQRSRTVTAREPRVKVRDPIRPYRYQARSYPWAKRVLAASEAKYGKPDDEVAA